MTRTKIQQSSQTSSVFEYMDGLVNRKRKAGRHSTADLYRASSNWLRKFYGNSKLTFWSITPELIDHFHTYLQTQCNLKVNTINSYLSNIRAMYHTAQREKKLPINIPDPFSHLNLQREKTAKRAITLSILQEVAALDLNDKPSLAQARDLCFFSFLACGIPFVDLVHLTKDHIIGEDLVYNRIKTGTQIRVSITSGMWRLIRKYALPNNNYLFPLLPENCTHEHYKQILRNQNNKLKEIGSLLPIPIHFTTYVIRHTWATEALRNHIPVAIISQALGHTQEKTTRTYLAELDQSELKEANAIIVRGLDELTGVRA